MKTILRNTTLAIILLLITSACSSSGKPQKPQMALNEDQMVEIISDIEIIEAKLHFIKEKGGNVDTMKDGYYKQLFDHYGITKEQFTENVTYYTQLPSKLEDIMTRVTDSLSSNKP